MASQLQGLATVDSLPLTATGRQGGKRDAANDGRAWRSSPSVVSTACSASGAGSSGKLQVAASVAPISDIVRNVAGAAADVEGLIPEGGFPHLRTDPSDRKTLSNADVIFLNGLDLEDPTLAPRRGEQGTTRRSSTRRPRDRRPTAVLYDFSFPESEGHPNPHLWMDVRRTRSPTRARSRRARERDPANAATTGQLRGLLATLAAAGRSCAGGRPHDPGGEPRAAHLPRFLRVLRGALRDDA